MKIHASALSLLLAAAPMFPAGPSPASPAHSSTESRKETRVATSDHSASTLSANGSSLSMPGLLPDLSWVPPADGYDWIQLKSGEWLKGRIKAMQDRHMEFSSEELKDLSFEWKDIRQVRSPHQIDVLFLTGEKCSGPILVTPTTVTIGGAVPQTYTRNMLQSLTPGGPRERDYWSGKLSLGFTAHRGNTKSIDYNAQAHLQRRTTGRRLSFDYMGNISRVQDVESANNQRVNSEFDFRLGQGFYAILPSAEYYDDPFQNLKYRLTVGAGIGYHIIDRADLNWSIKMGPAYQRVQFDSTQPGQATTKGTAALTFGSRFDWDITRRLNLSVEYMGQYTKREVGETAHHSVTTLSLEMTKRLNLDASLVWDRIGRPKEAADGVQPKPDDVRLIVGLGIDY